MTMVVLMDATRMSRTMKEGRRERAVDMVLKRTTFDLLLIFDFESVRADFHYPSMP